MGKKFVKIDAYGSLVFPIELLDKVLEKSYIVNTTWESDGEKITDVKPLDKFLIFDEDEIRAVLAQKTLEGNS